MLVVKNPPDNAGDTRDAGSNPGLGRSPGEGNGNPLQYSCLENPMDRGAWWASPQSYKELDIPEQLMLSQQIWRKAWQPTPVFLPGESHGQRSLVGYSPRGRKESDTTERLHFHFQRNKRPIYRKL